MIFNKQKITILFIDTLLIFLGLAGFYHISQKATLPLLINSQNNSLIISGTKSNLNAELIGAAINKLNGVEINLLEHIEFLCDGLSIGDEVLIESIKNDNVSITKINLVPFYNFGYLAVVAIASLSFLFIGILVFVRKSVNDKSALIFHNLMILTFLIMTTTWGNFAIYPYGMGILLRIVFSTAYTFAGITFVHFTFLFPREKWEKLNYAIYPLYGFSLLLSVLLATSFIFAARDYSLEWFQQYLFYFDICRIFFALSGIFAIINFIHSYKYSIEEVERRKLRWILIGTFIGPLSFILLWIIPQTLTSQGLVGEEVILLILIIVPVTYSISILKYHLMNIDIIFNRGTVYGLVLFLVLTIYTIIVGGAATLIGTATLLSSSIASGFAIVIIVLIFDPARRAIQKLVDKKFFRIQYDYRIAQREIIELINSSKGFDDLFDLLFNKINNNISVERIAFFKYDSANDTYSLIKEDNYSIWRSVDLQKYQSDIINESGVPSFDPETVEAGAKFIPAEKQLFKLLDLSSSFTLLSQTSKIVGLLLLGPKKSQLRFSLEDIDLLNTTLKHIVLTIEKIELQNKLILEKAETIKLKELSELKSLFVSSVSHEFKTPLTSIKMFAEMLQTSYQINDEKKLEYLQIIEGETERLSRMINNVLDFSKIEKGVKDYTFETIELNSVVNHVVKLMEYQLKLNRFDYKVLLSEKELMINADKDAIEEVLINLISNSIKYSKENKIITVTTCDKDGFAIIKISDKGIGIEEEELKRIFQPFYRVGDKTSRMVGGTGLGLAVVKHIMDSHEAIIEVISKIGVGSEFILSFKKVNKQIEEDTIN